MKPTILMLGTFDTKGREFLYLRSELLQHGANVLTMNLGTFGTTELFKVDVEAETAALAAGTTIEKIRQRGERSFALETLSRGAGNITEKLYANGQIHGVIGMGGGGGTTVSANIMRRLPVGVPKICISTLASGETSPYVGTKDLLLFPSIVDISGVNRFSRTIMSAAASAVCAMAENSLRTDVGADDGRKTVFISMFGNTTRAVEKCAGLFEDAGVDALIFHATGTGGRSMEQLILEGYAGAVLDMTTTEWADEICGGILNAGEERMDAAGKMGIPQVIVPGCVDMVNFGPLNTVPEKYRDGTRTLYSWGPYATLMRTNVKECQRLGRIFAEKAKRSTGLVKFLLPLGGLSELDVQGGVFYDPEADRALFEAIKQNAGGVQVLESKYAINDPEFSRLAVDTLLSMMVQEPF